MRRKKKARPKVLHSSHRTHVPGLLEEVVFSENVGHERPRPSPQKHADQHREGRKRGGHSGRQSDLGNLPVLVALKVRPVPEIKKTGKKNKSTDKK